MSTENITPEAFPGPPTRKRRFIMVVTVFTALAVAVGTTVWLGVAQVWGSPRQAAAARETVIAAVGDMACSPEAAAKARASGNATNGPGLCREVAVSDAVMATRPRALLALGDLQYETGSPDDWASYTESYGRMRDVTYPVPGNHEYLTLGAHGYYNYFANRAGELAHGYYSFDTGGWHIIALNSQCGEVGGCGPKSPQVTWLTNDLDQHRSACTLAFWHIPRFSSGEHGDHTPYQTFWQTLADHGADLVLGGHDHDYERFAPMDANGTRDDTNGIRSFVVGTGGKNLRPVTAQRANSERAIDDSYGFLELHLRSGDYSWQFKNEHGVVLDEGEGRCH